MVLHAHLHISIVSSISAQLGLVFLCGRRLVCHY